MPWVTVTTKSGFSYTDWQKPVPRIPNLILNSIVYLYRDTLDAETGVQLGGSGFLLVMESSVGRPATHIYVVTNAHVVEDGCPVVRINLKDPSNGYELTRSFDFPQNSWCIHGEHDLAVHALPVDLQTHNFSMALLSMNMLVMRLHVISDQIGPGDDLFYVGRFMDHAGKFKNMPSVRFGNISMLPDDNEPIEVRTDARRRQQVGFLVEARSRSGYSGSPVFMYYGKHSEQHGIVIMDINNIRLLGVDWGHLPERVELKDPSGYLDGGRRFVEVHAGMMGVVPAWYLKEFIETAPELIEQRARDDEYYRTHPPTGVPD